MTTRQKMANYFRAGYSGLFVTSYEEERAQQEVAAAAKDAGCSLYVYTVTDSLIGPVGKIDSDGKEVAPTVFNGPDGGPLSPEAVLEMMVPPKTEGAHKLTIPENSVVLAKDFHLWVNDSNPLMVRRVKDALQVGRLTCRHFVILAYTLKLMPELEKEFTVVDFALPTREELHPIMQGIADNAGIALNGNTDQIKDAASGMTSTEAADAFALAVVESGKTEISPAVVSREKCAAVKKTGLLEVVDQKVTLADIGGLENLKSTLYDLRDLFTKEAREYGLQAPRGILVVGQPGTGKSLTATATGSIFNIPLLRLEAGKLFGSLVGQSEQNWRMAFSTAKAISPVCFWIDEVDGLVTGAKSSGQTDGGTTARVVKAILQDMQFNSEGIFYVFTANDIDGLPDPLIDRLDVWSVDLPNQQERESIWAIHIAKPRAGQTTGRKPDAFSIPTLAKLTDGFSGRQIEQVWLAAMVRAFNDGKREPVTDDVTAVAGKFIPTSVTMAAQIEARRKRLEGRAQMASAAETVRTTEKKGRKLSV